ncbi:diversity-generating retroelement protein Avd [Desulfobacter hydrogenophilus]|uniref:Diversity-generating retroelement protein Avd n=1 Tax=Desulfobacter hydrogenophilus TaxID=2291 RepID=A0A328F6W7_9BACT|nr:diversity-generating retroelement protein Avd [Desulfobacter hydrogenophilus]NDY73997.1 diversity-generating retroelement protein Avd [Desulfobacter hydrogenophilus]QBH14342.1 diversity-generating retroelement protein Avd [Desulfobacter hydrogenophilus]RAM00344.1 diversity-generating retroelement protein Avd [Desulfobacter hydrogenophilus]
MSSTYGSLKIQQKWEDMTVYAYVALRQMPKSERFTLGAEIRSKLWSGFQLIIKANASRNKMPFLFEIDVEIKTLLALTRVAYGMKIIPFKQYEHLSVLLVELGKMLGGWMKYGRS